MPLEAASFIDSLEPANPAATDQIRQADDHLRLIKQVLQNTFPNITGPVTLSQDDLNSPPVIPVGIIVPYFGATAPDGWAICDGGTYDLEAGGTLVTPDLRGRVIIGASVSAPPNTVLGAATSEVDTNGAGAHTHTVDGGAHTHSTAVSSSGGAGTLEVTRDASSTWDKSGGSGNPVSNVSLTGGSTHTHDVTVGSSTHSHAVSSAPNHTHTVTVPVIQPSFALHMIIKL